MTLELLLNILFGVLGGLGLFLLGMKYMSEGMQAVAGARLRQMINAVTDRRLLAVLVGTSITCLIQSSSITTVMVVGLVNSGFMTLKQAIGVIFGANIGTTITGWIITLHIGKYGLPLLGISALLFLFSKNEKARYTGMVFMGIGMVFFGLELMSGGLKPLRGLPDFQAWFHAFEAHSYLGVLKCALVGCAVTMIVQSSSATLAITMSLARMGVINFETAAALVLGENIGTTITALLASIGGTRNARRAAYAHTVFNVLGVLWITALFTPYIELIKTVLHVDPGLAVAEEGGLAYPHAMGAIALVHTGFNVINTLLFIPLLPLLAKLVTRMAPDRETEEPARLRYLDVRMLDTPSLGIAQSLKEIEFMADSTHLMMDRMRRAYVTTAPEPENERKLFHREEILDNAQKEVTEYLSRILTGSVPLEVAVEGRRQLRLADEYESVSDYIANLLKMVLRLRKNGLAFTPEGLQEILAIHDQTAALMETVRAAVPERPAHILSQVHSECAQINRQIKEARKRHLTRLERGEVPPMNSLIFSDVLNALRRIKDHVQNIAEALDSEG